MLSPLPKLELGDLASYLARTARAARADIHQPGHLSNLGPTRPDSAIEALAATLPLFLLLFASAYITMANSSASSFNHTPLTRTDALYFNVTVFATVGFGDTTAVSQIARLVVTVQMLLDLLVLGLVVRAFIAAVQFGRREAEAARSPVAADPG
jgi:hypothetical protein